MSFNIGQLFKVELNNLSMPGQLTQTDLKLCQSLVAENQSPSFQSALQFNTSKEDAYIAKYEREILPARQQKQ